MASVKGDNTNGEIKLRREITQLHETNESLLAEMKRQNEYDIRRGLTPGSFREHHTLHCVGENKKRIRELQRELEKLSRSGLFSFTSSKTLPNATNYIKRFFSNQEEEKNKTSNVFFAQQSTDSYFRKLSTSSRRQSSGAINAAHATSKNMFTPDGRIIRSKEETSKIRINTEITRLQAVNKDMLAEITHMTETGAKNDALKTIESNNKVIYLLENELKKLNKVRNPF